MKKNNALRYLVQTAGHSAVGIGGLLTVQILQGVASVSYALFLRNIINAAVAGDRAGFWLAIGRLVLLFALQLGLSAVRCYLTMATKSQLENRFKSRLFAGLLERDYACVSAVHSGEWMNRLTNDTVVAADGMVEILPGLAGMAVKLVGAVAMIIVLEKRFLWLVVPGGAMLLMMDGAWQRMFAYVPQGNELMSGTVRQVVSYADPADKGNDARLR